MKIIEIFSDCLGDPIRLGYVDSGLFANSVGIVVSDNETTRNAPRYELHISCTEADINTILDIAKLQNLPQGEGGRITLAEKGHAFCVKGKDCVLCRLSVEELLIPIAIDELTTNKFLSHEHWDD